MNETLQQFCQRILPVVQAGAEGKEIEEKCSIGNSIWEGKIARLFLPDYEYRVAKPKATPLPITPEMWAMIDPKYKFAVMSKGGNIVLIAGEKPINNGGHWVLNNSEYCQSPLSIDISGIVPELSLTERPKSADEQLKPIFVDGVRVGTLNQFGEVTGSEYDPDLTRKELDRLCDEHLAKAAPKCIIDGDCDVHGADVHVDEESLLERALKLAEAAEDLSRKVKNENSRNIGIAGYMYIYPDKM